MKEGRTMKKMICLSVVFAVFFAFAFVSQVVLDRRSGSLEVSMSTACAAEQWEKDLHEICSNTQNAMSMSQDELKAMIGKCDDLRPDLEKLEPKRAKIMLRKLNRCRDLYFFMIESSVIKE